MHAAGILQHDDSLSAERADDVVSPLERLAAKDGTSVGAVAVRELADVSRRVDNPGLLDELPDLRIDLDNIVEELGQARSER